MREKSFVNGQATDNNIIRRMRIACYISKAINTHSEYVIRIVFPPQQWLHDRASLLRHSTLRLLLNLFPRPGGNTKTIE
jgi:hypothetical protein